MKRSSKVDDDLQKEFSLNGSGLRFVLVKSASELVQRDMDRFFAAYARFPQGNTVPEDNGKTLRAAVEAGWIAEPQLSVGDVDNLKPGHVRWYARCIDQVITKAREIPNA